MQITREGVERDIHDRRVEDRHDDPEHHHGCDDLDFSA
jgi:hypothetical protein